MTSGLPEPGRHSLCETLLPHLEPGYRYRAHGLSLSSAIELPEMALRSAGAADVVIRYGTVPETLENAISRGPRHQIAPGEYLLEVPGIARYWVRRGAEVVVAPAPGADEEDIRAFILSSVMGALSHQNGFLPLHASAVDVGGACVLFTGACGHGKSTLAAACHVRGHPLISDDLSAISLDEDGRAVAHSGYRAVKLWADAIAGLGSDLGQARPLRERVGKYSVALPGGPAADALPVRAIFALASGASDEFAIQALLGADKVRVLKKGTYRARLVPKAAGRAGHFALAARVARQTPIALLHRPTGLANLMRIVDRLEESGWAPRAGQRAGQFTR